MVTIYEKNLSASYTPYSSLDDTECFYCGECADFIDHCPPVILCTIYPNYQRYLVKSCKDCNVLLRSKFLPTLLSRLEHILSKLKRKYSSVLKMPDWSNEDLIDSEITGALKKYIEIELKNKRIVEDRIQWARNKINLLQENI